MQVLTIAVVMVGALMYQAHYIDKRFDDFRLWIEAKFIGLQDHIVRVEARLDGVETRLTHLEDRTVRIEARLDGVETRLDKIEERLERPVLRP